MNEITAWQTGVDLARTGEALETLLALPGAVIDRLLTPAARDALTALEGEVWAHWVRVGYADASKEQRP